MRSIALCLNGSSNHDDWFLDWFVNSIKALALSSSKFEAVFFPKSNHNAYRAE